MNAIQRWFVNIENEWRTGPDDLMLQIPQQDQWCKAKDVETLEHLIENQSKLHAQIRESMQKRIDALQAQLESPAENHVMRANLDLVHMELNHAKAQGLSHEYLDTILADCPLGECERCGIIICPHGDGMHFHHDGCPSCADAENSASTGL